jgi:hypothetical protein
MRHRRQESVRTMRSSVAAAALTRAKPAHCAAVARLTGAIALRFPVPKRPEPCPNSTRKVGRAVNARVTRAPYGVTHPRSVACSRLSVISDPPSLTKTFFHQNLISKIQMTPCPDLGVPDVHGTAVSQASLTA